MPLDMPATATVVMHLTVEDLGSLRQDPNAVPQPTESTEEVVEEDRKARLAWRKLPRGDTNAVPETQ